MKTFNQFFIILLISTAFIACKNDDDGGDGGPAGAGTIEASVDGASFTSTPMLTTATAINLNGTSTISITGSDMGGRNISISIIGVYDGVGTYSIGGGANIVVTASYTEGSTAGVETWVAPYDDVVAGELNISNDTDTNLTGTFNFMCKNGNDNSIKNITSGSFNVNF